jgi:hypothetical protein
MIDLSKLFRERSGKLEIFVTGLSLGFTRVAREKNSNLPDAWLTRTSWINEQVSAYQNQHGIDFSTQQVILDCRMENIYVAQLGISIIDRFSIPKENVKILISVPGFDYVQEYDYEFDRLAEINFCYFYDDLLKENIDWKNIVVDTPFLSLSGRPTESRAVFTKHLLDFFGEKSRASIGVTSHYPLSDKDLSLYKAIMHPYDFPFAQGTDGKDLGDIHLQHNPPGQQLYRSLVSLVHETNDHQHDHIFLTEKTFKVFAWHQLPIFVATPGHVAVVRSLGFDLFDDIIDHSYDTENASLHLHRMRIFSQLSTFLSRYPTIDDVRTLRAKLWPRLEANNKLLSELIRSRGAEPWPYYN